MEEFVALRPKMCSYLTDNGHADKRTIATKKCAIKWAITFEDFKKCLENNRTILRTQQRFRIEAHIIFTKKVNKITLSANDDKRIQTPDGSTTYSYGYGCWAESLEHTKIESWR